MSKTLVSFIIHTFESFQSCHHVTVIIMPVSRNTIYLKAQECIVT